MKAYYSKITMQTIADMLHTSKNSVSIALSGKRGISDQLREKIIQKAEELNYVYKKTVKSCDNSNILIIAPQYVTSDTLFYSKIIWKIEKYAQENNCTVTLSSLSSQAEKELQYPRINITDYFGILVLGVVSERYVNLLRKLNIPIVLIDNFIYSLQIDTVVTANAEGGYLATKYLIDLGHKDIGFIGSISITSSFYQRWCGFNKAMMDAGLSVSPEFNILADSPLPVLFSSVESISEVMASKSKMPTAWFCANDRIACSVISYLNSKGLRVPDDISIVGFDNIELSSLYSPKITTISVNRNEIAKNAVDLLLHRFKNDGIQHKVSIYGNLVIRESAKSL